MNKMFAFGLIALLACSPLHAAGKKQVNSAADLPAFTYPISGALSELLLSDAKFRPFAKAMRVHDEGLLRDYDIQDKAALQEIQTRLLNLDILEGRNDAALARIPILRDLESKPEAKLYDKDRARIAAIASARKASGSDTGTAYRHAFEVALSEQLKSIPATFAQRISASKLACADLDATQFPKAVDALQKSASLTSLSTEGSSETGTNSASLILVFIAAQRLYVPVKDDMAQVYGDWLSVHSVVRNNIWPSRAVDLTHEQGLSPVVVAIWDDGVDPDVFPGHIWVNSKESANGRDNDGNGFIADVNGIAFDAGSNRVEGLLLPIGAADRAQVPAWARLQLGASDRGNGLDTDEARAYAKKIKQDTPKEAAEWQRASRLLGDYAHGTECTSIAVAGNPAVRILIARNTSVSARTGELDPLPYSDALVKRMGTQFKDAAGYFNAHGVRVVNMSWGYVYTDIEGNLVKYNTGKDAAERSRLAHKWFEELKAAMRIAISSAPNTLFVEAAGNTNNDTEFVEDIPSSLGLPNVLNISAVDETGAAASFSSFGKGVDLYANGVAVDLLVPGGARSRTSGSSAAAPQVVNLAAKLIAVDPTLTVADVVALIRDGADENPDSKLLLIHPKHSMELLQSRMAKTRQANLQ